MKRIKYALVEEYEIHELKYRWHDREQFVEGVLRCGWVDRSPSGCQRKHDEFFGRKEELAGNCDCVFVSFEV